MTCKWSINPIYNKKIPSRVILTRDNITPLEEIGHEISYSPKHTHTTEENTKRWREGGEKKKMTKQEKEAAISWHPGSRLP
jgi:hypothetical protein